MSCSCCTSEVGSYDLPSDVCSWHQLPQLQSQAPLGSGPGCGVGDVWDGVETGCGVGAAVGLVGGGVGTFVGLKGLSTLLPLSSFPG